MKYANCQDLNPKTRSASKLGGAPTERRYIYFTGPTLCAPKHCLCSQLL